ncbi:Uncharacterized protein FWK35_00034181, partial [Aphis craccivora]
MFLLAELYDLELILRFLVFGETRYLDTRRMSQLFPAREVRPGVRRRLRRDKDGFCTFEPSSIGQFRTLRPNELFGNVPVGRFVRQLVVSIFNYLTVDILKCSPEEAAHAWVTLTSRVVSNEAGMGTSNAAGLAFRIRRLVREYGTSEGQSFGRLSVAGTVPAKDVYRAFVNCHCYKLAIIKLLFERRSDFEIVKLLLKGLIEAEFEVVPMSFLVTRSHRAMCDWIFVGDVEKRSTSYGESSNDFYQRRRSYWLDNKRTSKVFNFGSTVHYPVGSRILNKGTAPDIVYRRVPVYTPDVRRSLSVAVTTQANIRREKAMVDIGACAPKNPIV